MHMHEFCLCVLLGRAGLHMRNVLYNNIIILARMSYQLRVNAYTLYGSAQSICICAISAATQCYMGHGLPGHSSLPNFVCSQFNLQRDSDRQDGTV